jgi:hypothetical protein
MPIRDQNKKNETRITGSYATLASAVAEKNMDTLGRAPRFVPNWLANPDESNGHWIELILLP